MHKVFAAVAVLALLVAAPATAAADSFTVDNITVNFTNDATNKGTVPRVANNDVFGLNSSNALDAYFGTYLSIETGIDTYIQVEYIGKEAAWTNKLLANGGTTAFSTASASLGDTYNWFQTADGRIDFELTTNKGTASTSDDVSVDNTVSGDNPNDKSGTAGGINFAVVHLTSDFVIDNDSFTDSIGDNVLASVLADGTVLKAGLYIVLDDGGAGSDDNHDDLVFRISATPVPEPGTLMLMGLGLTALGVTASRRRRKRTGA